MADLYRSGNQKVIAGVCAGMADRFDLNLSGVRWATALVSLFLTGIPVIVYLVLWAVLKERSTGGANA